MILYLIYCVKDTPNPEYVNHILKCEVAHALCIYTFVVALTENHCFPTISLRKPPVPPPTLTHILQIRHGRKDEARPNRIPMCQARLHGAEEQGPTQGRRRRDVPEGRRAPQGADGAAVPRARSRGGPRLGECDGTVRGGHHHLRRGTNRAKLHSPSTIYRSRRSGKGLIIVSFHPIPGGAVLPALRPQETRGAHRPAQHWPPRAEATADAGRRQVHRRHPTYVIGHQTNTKYQICPLMYTC